MVANVSFAGYSLLPGSKFFIGLDDVVVGKGMSIGEIKILHDAKRLAKQVMAISTDSEKQGLAPSDLMTCMELHGTEIYMH
jgi:hypothetical protein